MDNPWRRLMRHIYDNELTEFPGGFRRVTTIADLWPSNAYVQATRGVGSVNFRTADFGGAFFNWSHCVLCVLSDAWVLRCMTSTFCVKEADWGMVAFVAYFAPWGVHRPLCEKSAVVHHG